MTKLATLAQRDLLCSNCAGQCVYAPSTGTLTCNSCATEHQIIPDPNADPAAEQHYHPDMPHTEQPRFATDRHFQCDSCGGDVVFQGHSISENCPYCNGSLVEQAFDESFAILGMIPFAITDRAAQEKAQDWVKRRWAAPSNLGALISNCRVAGIYVPFWTFDSKEAIDYTVRYKKKVGKRSYTRSLSGSMKTYFDDLLMPASPHVTPLIRDGILHDFDPDKLRPFEPAYLAGFAAERHHQTVKQGLACNADDKALLLRNRIIRHSGKSNIVDVSYLTDTTGIKYRRILLPAWILHYEYEGQPMKVITCGLNGRTFGERPFSMLKLFTYAAVLSSLAAGFGFVWGALNIY
ncbi:hypothetical protein [Planktotalea sp.]|uniref:hypothetical protein n=1 Tax=Planktotalea sp. TaxID=2029877 RepID=UPI003D6B4334